MNADLLRDLYLSGMKLADIAARVGCTASNVSDRAKRMGLPPRQRSTGDLPQKAIVAAYRSGMSSERIAAKVGGDGSVIRNVLRANGVVLRGRHDLVIDLRGECVRLFRAGWFCREIAAHLGITTFMVRKRVNMVLGKGTKGDGGRRRSARFHRQERVTP